MAKKENLIQAKVINALKIQKMAMAIQKAQKAQAAKQNGLELDQQAASESYSGFNMPACTGKCPGCSPCT